MLSVTFSSFSQDIQANKQDSFQFNQNSAYHQVDHQKYSDQNQIELLVPKTYLVLLGNSLEKEFLKPFHTTGKEWKDFGFFAAGTGALFLVDKPVQQDVLRLREKKTSVNDISHYVTDLGGLYEGVALAGIAGYGLIFKDRKLVNTTLLATQAYVTGGIVTTFIKFIAGETRPSYYTPSEIASPRFLGPFAKAERDANGKKTYSSFPSGHSTVAFAVAAVFASEYKDKPAIPIIAYSIASLIGISRVTENVHWTTDVVVGAALGYLTGKNVVNNYHRYVKAKERGIT